MYNFTPIPVPLAQVPANDTFNVVEVDAVEFHFEKTAGPVRLIVPRPSYATLSYRERNSTQGSRQSIQRTAEPLSLPTFSSPLTDYLTALLSIYLEELSGRQEGLPVSPHAYQVIYTLLADASDTLLLPEGDLYTDGDGGLRLEWRRGEKQTRLSVHVSDVRENYIYWQEGDKYGIETNINSVSLVASLKWLLSTSK